MNRILIVDDTESVRITLKMALEVNDFEVIAASTVTEAFALLRPRLSTF